jgi:hypothetical protein
MKAAIVGLVTTLGASSALADGAHVVVTQQVDVQIDAAPSAATIVVTPEDAPPLPPPPAHWSTFSLEAASTFSGAKAPTPAFGLRAAALKDLGVARFPEWRLGLAVIGRLDRHGSGPDLLGPEVHASSWGAGLRLWAGGAGKRARSTGFFELTTGRTVARTADIPMERGSHWMAGAGVLVGLKGSPVNVLWDFGWMVTDVARGRIGPIMSLGLNVGLD